MRQCLILHALNHSVSISGARVPPGAVQPKKVSSDYDAARDLSIACKQCTSKGTRRALEISKLIRNRLRDYKDFGTPLGTRTFSIALSNLASARATQHCDDLFAEMRSRKLTISVADFNQVLKVHTLSKNYSTVDYYWRMLNDTPHLKPDEVSFLYYIRLTAATKPLPDIYAALEEATIRFRNNSDKMMMLYTTVAPAVPPKVGFRFLEIVKNPDLVMYSAVLASCGSESHHNVLAAEKIVAMVKKAGFKLDLVFYNRLLVVYVTDCNFKACMDILRRMSSDKINPDCTTYRLAINSCQEKAAGDPSHSAVSLARLLFQSAYNCGFGSYSSLYMAMLELSVSINDSQQFTDTVEKIKSWKLLRGAAEKYVEKHNYLLLKAT